MAEKNEQDNKGKRRDTNSLLSDLLEETRRDAELELIQLEQEQNRKKLEEKKHNADEEKQRKKDYQRQLEAEKRKRADALKRFEERKRQKENPRPVQAEATKEPESTGKFPVWATIVGGIVVLGVAVVAIIILTRPSNPPIVFNPPAPDGAGKAIAYAMANVPFGPSTIHYENALTTEQVILNTTPSPYIVKPKPKKVVKRVKHHVKHHKKRVKIHVKLFSPGSIIK